MSGLTNHFLTSYLRRANRSLESQETDRRQDSGVTLLETLVAIIVVTIVVAVITPPIFLAVGTRVRHRKTEQAMQIAQDEIERVRLLMLGDEVYANIVGDLPPIETTVGKDNVGETPAPTAFCADVAPCGDAQELALTVDDTLFVQSFREPGAVVTLPGGDPNVLAFRMGVRVYGRDAFVTAGGAVRNDLDTEASPIRFTSGAGYIDEPKPLVTLYTELVRGTQGGGLAAIQEW